MTEGRRLGFTPRGLVYEARIVMECGRCHRPILRGATYVRKMKRGGGRNRTYPTCTDCYPHSRPTDPAYRPKTTEPGSLPTA